MPPVTPPTTTQIRLVWRRGCLVLSLAMLGSALPGCGNALYAVSASRAASKLEEARQLGAERTTPYEYTLAQEHLNKAMTEASEADYGDAFELARLANEYATQAVDKARLRLRAPRANGAAAPSRAANPHEEPR